MSSDSLANTENGQPVPRVVVFLFGSFSTETLSCQDLSHAYVTIFLPLDFVVDFRVMKAYPRAAAHVLIAVTSSSRDWYSASGGRQLSGNASVSPEEEAPEIVSVKVLIMTGEFGIIILHNYSFAERRIERAQRAENASQ